MATNLSARPAKNRMYGLTHELDGTPIIREPRVIKVGIGVPKGRSVLVWIDAKGNWCVQHEKDKIARFASKEEARAFYKTARDKAPERRYPQKLPYFIFTKVSPQWMFEPDFDAIEAHGPTPTEIDIVFFREEPFEYAYEMWTAAERKCFGDGMNGMRVLSMARTEEEKRLAEEAKRAGERHFPVINQCRVMGCPYAQTSGDDAPPCKPHGRLLFQLLSRVSFGGSAYFDTTGFRSVSQLHSNLEMFRGLTDGHIAGIPLKMIVRPYRTSHNGKPATQYGVHLEFPDKDAATLRKNLLEHVRNFRGEVPVRPAPKELPPAMDVTDPQAEDVEPPPVIAAAMEAEFGGGDPVTDEDDFELHDVPQEAPLMMPRRNGDSPRTGSSEHDGSY